MKKFISTFVVIVVNTCETGEFTIDTHVYNNEGEALAKKAELIRERLSEVGEDGFDNVLTDHNIEAERVSCLYGANGRYDVQVQERRLEVDIEDVKYLECENMILMSSDIFKDVYAMDGVWDYQQAARIIYDSAIAFEEKWQNGLKDEENSDYIEELEKFEQEEMKKFKKLYE